MRQFGLSSILHIGIALIVANIVYDIVALIGFENTIEIKLLFMLVFLMLYWLYMLMYRKFNDIIMHGLDDIEQILDLNEQNKHEKPWFMQQGTLTSRLNQLVRIVAEEHAQITNLEKITEAKSKTLETITHVSHQYLDTDHDSDYYHLILASAIEVIENATRGSLLILDPSTGLYKYQTCVGYDLDTLKHVEFRIEQTFLGHQTVDTANIVRGIEDHDHANLTEEQYAWIEKAGGLELSDVLSAPIFINDVIYAILNIDSDIPNAFDNIDIQLIQYFTMQISMALKNKLEVDETVRQSKRDRLTGVYNRNYFEQYLQKFDTNAIDHYETYAIVLCDLDNLKVANDTYGHSAGDEILKAFANLLASEIRSSDVLARIGGDEFIIIFSGMNMLQAHHQLERIYDKCKSLKVLYNASELPVSFSYGIASSPEDSMVYTVLHKIADQRMYEFKKKHKSPL